MIPDQDPMKTEQRQEKVGTQECAGLFGGGIYKISYFMPFLHGTFS